MTNTWETFYVELGIAVLIFAIWLWKSSILSSVSRIFWTVILLIFLSVPILGTYCSLTVSGLGCLGWGIILGLPWGISALLLGSAFLAKIIQVLTKPFKTITTSTQLPGPAWLWVFIVIVVIQVLLYLIFSNIY